MGSLVVLTGPSGTGKGTVGARLRELHPELWFSVSATSRPPRPGEADGVHYWFIDRAEFMRRVDAGDFLEWFEVHGDLKGTPKGPILEHLAAGDDCLVEIDIQGALAVRREFPEALLIFLRPPSRVEQRRRLEGRGQDDAAAIERRLADAELEEAEALASGAFDAIVVNNEVDRTVDQVAAILASRRSGA
ncbi:MAG: guanylate kinase [Acidimicrobiia bacterium]